MTKSRSNNPLGGDLVPVCPSQLTQQDEDVVEAAISALCELCDDIKRYTEARTNGEPLEELAQDLQEQILRLWEGRLRDWLVYLFHFHHPHDDSSRFTVISYVSCALMHFIIFSQDRDVNSNQDYATLAIQLFEETEFDHAKSEYLLVHGWWNPLITVIHLTDCKKKIPPEKVTGIIDLIAIRLLKSSAPEMNNQEYTLLALSLEHIMKLDNSYGDELNRIVHRVTYALHWAVLHHPEPQDEQDNYLSAGFRLILIIKEKLIKANSVIALCEALRHSLMESIFRFMHHSECVISQLSEETLELAKRTYTATVFDLIKSYIPRMICFQSLINEIKLNLENEYFQEEHRSTVVAEGLHALRTTYRSASSLLEMPIARNIVLCDNPMHNMNIIPIKLYRCSGCKSAWYCSNECQKVNWDRTHRKQCAHLQLTRASSIHGGVAKRDHISILRSTIIFIAANTPNGFRWSNIEAAAKTKYPRKTMSQLSAVIDYTGSGLNSDVVPRDRAAATAALAVGPQATVIQCLVSFGPVVATITTAGDLSKGKVTVWYAGRSLTTYNPVTPVSDS